MRYPPIKTPNPVFRKSMTYNNILKCMEGREAREGRTDPTHGKVLQPIFSMVLLHIWKHTGLPSLGSLASHGVGKSLILFNPSPPSLWEASQKPACYPP